MGGMFRPCENFREGKRRGRERTVYKKHLLQQVRHKRPTDYWSCLVNLFLVTRHIFAG